MLPVEERIGYTFHNRVLLITALTHPSFAGDYHVESYQRLEFLGDAVLELNVSELLYHQHKKLPEGMLTRMRAELVCEEALSEAARKLALHEELRLSVGEERSGGRSKPSILCDVMEAVIGAVYLDGGYEEAKKLILLALGDMAAKQPENKSHLDVKSSLQALLQSRGQMPKYELVSQSGPAHMPEFVYRVLADAHEIGQGTGRSKQAAQIEAARSALARLNENTENM